MQNLDVTESIAAISTPGQAGLRGVIRVSGPKIHSQLSQCLILGQAEDLPNGGPSCQIDCRMDLGQPIGPLPIQLLFWPTSASYTRQPCGEIHCTGSLPILNDVMRRLNETGIRQAQPGEFTMRAFLAGRIDLAQAEAVLGVIDSESEQELQLALRQMSGGLSGSIAELQEQLLQVLAHLEAGLDFVEEDIEFITQDELSGSIGLAEQQLQEILRKLAERSLDQRRPRLVLTGRPNVGKSSLQNALTQQSASIVTDVAGTTRDYVVGQLDLFGLTCDLIDTAGDMRGAELARDTIQKASEAQLDQVAETADLILLCVDGTQPVDPWTRQMMQQADLPESNLLVIVTKLDLIAAQPARHDVIYVSSTDGRGLNELKRELSRRLLQQEKPTEMSVITATGNRCRESLHNAETELQNAQQYCLGGHGDEVVAAALRVALDELAVVTGRVFTDDILDRVFSRFCIGK